MNQTYTREDRAAASGDQPTPFRWTVRLTTNTEFLFVVRVDVLRRALLP
jgi:hypothetical protein